MSLLMRNLSPFQLREEILRLLLNQHLGQRQSAPGYPPGARGPAFAPFPGFGGPNPATGTAGYQEEDEAGEQPQMIPALFDPDEDEMPNNPYEACKDRCYQQNRHDIRACYKKRGRIAKALCITAANTKYGSCIGACAKYRK